MNMVISYVPCCKNCGEHLLGDGYTDVMHCPYADDDATLNAEPDSGPVYCNFKDGEDI